MRRNACCCALWLVALTWVALAAANAQDRSQGRSYGAAACCRRAAQAQAHAQFVSNVVDFGMNIQAALEAPRFTKMTFTGCDVAMEDRIPEEVRKALAARGHRIELRGDYSEDMGGGQAVLRNFSTGVNYGASDPRKDGEAIPQPESRANP